MSGQELADMILTSEPSKDHTYAGQADFENINLIIAYMRFDDEVYSREIRKVMGS